MSLAVAEAVGHAAQVFRDIEISLVQRQGLHERRVGSRRCTWDLLGHCPIDLKAGGTKISSAHCRSAVVDGMAETHAEFAGFVAGCSDDTPLRRVTHRHRPTTKRRIIPLLDRRRTHPCRMWTDLSD